jgi:hypothetical protein
MTCEGQLGDSCGVVSGARLIEWHASFRSTYCTWDHRLLRGLNRLSARRLSKMCGDDVIPNDSLRGARRRRDTNTRNSPVQVMSCVGTLIEQVLHWTRVSIHESRDHAE